MIIDFGLVRPIKSTAFDNPKNFLGFGTPGFRAPEQSKQPVDPEFEPEDIEHVAWNAGHEINERLDAVQKKVRQGAKKMKTTPTRIPQERRQ